jgi:PIN domain nuclease of toxin-antitoxin system
VSRFLVDSHALLWWLADDPALPRTARQLIAAPANEPLVSMASLWEIAIKRSLGKLDVPGDLPQQVVEQGFVWLGIDPAHAWLAGALPWHHRDPFDRLLIAQALHERLAVVTGDPAFRAYGVDVRW